MTEQQRTADDFSDSGEIYRSLFHNVLNGVVYGRVLYENNNPADFVFVACNEAFLAQTGLANIGGRKASEVLPGMREAEPEILRRFGKIAKYGIPERFEVYIEPLKVWFTVSTYSPKPEHFVAVFEVITERKKTEEGLMLAGMVFRETGEAIMITDENNIIVTVNPAFERLTCYRSDEVIGQHTSILQYDAEGEDVSRSIVMAMNASGYWKGEIWSRRKDGEKIAASVTINTHFNQDGAVHRRIVLLSDITEKKRSQEMIWRQANYDSLTGLPNRQLFREHLRQQIRKARRDNESLVLMYMEIDGLKEIYSSLGLQLGDHLLKTLAERLNSCIQEADNVARFGGDEFMMVLNGLSDIGDIDCKTRQILEKIAEPVKLNGDFGFISVSIGITLYPGDGTEIDELIRNADQAMHAAKRSGKNRYQFFTPAMQASAMDRFRLISDMRSALASKQFEMVFQPIVELSSGSIHKAEALIRWQHPTRGLVNPFEFISAAEDTGMILSLGDWIFHQAVGQAAVWREKYQPAFQISVNISPAQFKSESIDWTVWFDHLKQLGMPGQGIVVEITERLLLDASAKVMDQLLILRNAGIQIALDDFGTGYSAIAYLKKFNVDYIKVDKAYVDNLAEKSNDMVLWEAVIAMAHKMGIKLIAEGIETQEQRRLLANAGCDYGQGYLFSRALPREEFESMLKAASSSNS